MNYVTAALREAASEISTARGGLAYRLSFAGSTDISGKDLHTAEERAKIAAAVSKLNAAMEALREASEAVADVELHFG